MFTPVALGAALLFCVARAAFDLRARRWGWAAAGIGCAIILRIVPVQTHAVKIDLPAAGAR